MASSLVILKKDLSGGEIFLSFWTNTKAWLCATFKMALLASFRQTFGGVKCKVILIQNFFSFAKNKSLSFQKAKTSEPFHRVFHLPLSEIAFAQLGLLQNLLTNQVLSTDTGYWSYIWGNPFFSSQKAYKHLIGHAQVHHSFRWLWNS